MKKNWKRLVAGMLAVLTVFGSVFSGVGVAQAASPSAKLQMWYASVKDHPVITEFNSYTYTGDIKYCMIDGSVAYCMNFTRNADGGQTMQSYNTPHTALSAAQEKLLSYCLYYGYGNSEMVAPNNTQKNQYIAETLALEPGPYFLIEYVGVYSVNGTDFYEFRCYRA